MSQIRSFMKNYTVEERHLAKNVGSGDASVLSTPSLIAFMEEVSHSLAKEFLDKSKTSVGTRLDIYHVSTAYEGETVEVESRLISSDGRRLIFYVQAKSGDKLLGFGIHERAVVDLEKFSRKESHGGK
ncbi:MAG: thioesterase family protein [Fervidicoccaceae archaeon]